MKITDLHMSPGKSMPREHFVVNKVFVFPDLNSVTSSPFLSSLCKFRRRSFVIKFFRFSEKSSSIVGRSL